MEELRGEGSTPKYQMRRAELAMSTLTSPLLNKERQGQIAVEAHPTDETDGRSNSPVTCCFREAPSPKKALALC
ncbi:hypothetical protein NL676_023925 [Syzygium grande]|nr:hypothetical protein NL676_023925 [Syzygium grande]